MPVPDDSLATINPKITGICRFATEVFEMTDYSLNLGGSVTLVKMS